MVAELWRSAISWNYTLAELYNLLLDEDFCLEPYFGCWWCCVVLLAFDPVLDLPFHQVVNFVFYPLLS